MQDNENTNFNFTQPIIEADNLNQYLDEKEKAIKANLATAKKTHSNGRAWILVFVLLLSLIALATYTLVKNRENENQIAALKNQTSTSTTDPSTQNIVTADNFSLVLNTPTPDNFTMDRKVITSPYLDNQTAVQVDFTGKNNKAGQDLISGIEVQVSEYDNKLDKTAFEQLVLSKLGDKYEIESTNISLPKNIMAAKIQQKDGNLDDTYYVAVTQDNYYVIKLYNEASRYSEFDDVSSFTNTLLPNLYLN
jgi:hypothetical protein